MKRLTSSDYFTHDELLEIKAALKKHKSNQVRLIIMLAIATGAREQEILNIEKADLRGDKVFIRGLKGSDNREVHIDKDLMRDLRALPAEDKLFTISARGLRKAWERMRPVNKRFHCFRHTFAVEVYKATRDIRFVQASLGHRNIQNTLVYAHLTDYEAMSRDTSKVLGKLLK